MSAAESSAPSQRTRKVRALLAGGLVLGVGAAITLAAWNDSEFAGGEFEAGTFNLEGSLDGTAFSEHASEAAAAPLNFSIDPTNLSPGDAVSAPFAVRLDAATTYDASAVVEGVTTTGTVENLTYELTSTDGFGCGTGTAATLIDAGTALGGIDADGAAFDLAAGTGSEAGATVNLCFTVTAGENLTQGQSGTATWEFLATSAN